MAIKQWLLLLFWLSCPPSVSWYGSFDNYCIFKMNAVTGDNLYVQKMCTFCEFWQCAVMLFLLFVWKCVSLQECACVLVTDFSKPSGDVYCNIQILVFSLTTFSALTLLVGRQEGHPACKKTERSVLVWLSAWSKMQTCIRPSWCHCHSLSLASVKSR